MKKIYISLAFVLSLLTLSTGCSDFLDEESREKVEAGDQQVYPPQVMLTSVYGMFNDWPYAFSFLGITEIISDNSVKGSSTTDPGTDK